MAALTDHAENLLLNWTLTAGAATRPTAWFAALHTSAPNDASPSTGELSGNGYTREAVTFAAASGGATSNTADIEFGPCTGSNWGSVTHISIWDASTTGNALFHGALSSAVTINVNDSLRFATGDIDVTLA